MVVRGIVFDKATSMKWLLVGSRGGPWIKFYPLEQDAQDRRIRLRAMARMARLRLTTITPMCLAELQRLGISTDDLKVVCIDEGGAE